MGGDWLCGNPDIVAAGAVLSTVYVLMFSYHKCYYIIWSFNELNQIIMMIMWFIFFLSLKMDLEKFHFHPHSWMLCAVRFTAFSEFIVAGENNAFFGVLGSNLTIFIVVTLGD